jgi:hypothetical protein
LAAVGDFRFLIRPGVTATPWTHFPLIDCTSGGDERIGTSVWGRSMSYQIMYNEITASRCDPEWRQHTSHFEVFTNEPQALRRARELLEAGEHHGVRVRDQSGNELSGIRLQLKLGGFSGN